MPDQENKVQFEEEASLAPENHSPLEEKPVTGLAKVLIDKNIAANKKSADFILIGIAVCFFMLMVGILVFGLFDPSLPSRPTYQGELKS